MTTSLISKLHQSQASMPSYLNMLGPYSMHEPSFRILEQQFHSFDLNRFTSELSPEHKRNAANSDRYYMTIVDGVAIVTISGMITKYPTWFPTCPSSVIRSLLNTALEDPRVFGCLLRINSPGGQVSGTRELANDVKKFGQSKPIVAYVDDLCCSAAYWVASQADYIVSNATGFTGSIGTYCIMSDYSQAMEQAGVKVHVIRAGEYKGSGEFGTKILDSHLMELQRQVDGLNAFFLEAVSQGRNLSGVALEQVTDGRAHLAADAKSLGLIDEVRDFENYFEAFYDSVLQSPFYAASPYRFVERADAFRISSYSDNEFVDDCVSKKLTVDECQKAWNQKQSKPTSTQKYVP